ncbi:MAG TPA: hypothetical protein VKA48_11225 [Gammaproteobacteria bacterium]|nr:hypothetical protein [Gammaproteobacteria bacterium]
MDNLIESYLAACTGSNRESLDELSAEMIHLGVWTRPAGDDLLSRWRRGRYTPPPEAVRYMARVAVGRVLREAGLETDDDAALDQVAAALTPPPRQR